MNPTGEFSDADPGPEIPSAGPMPGFASPPPPRNDPPSDPSPAQLDSDAGDSSAPPLTATSARRPVRPTLDPAAATLWQGVGKGIVRGVGGLLNMWQGVDEADAIWMPDEDEAAQMGEPLGRIIGRRAPMPGGDANPTDVADVVAIAIGMIGYGTRNAFEALRRRRERRKPPAQTIPADEPAPYTYGGAQ